MRWLLLGCVLAMSSCIQPDLLPCGNDLCPRGSMCVNDLCATPDQLAACTGATDGDACTLNTGSVGRCSGGVCAPTGCGNATIDPGERCDDGNVSSGDGCSGTCDSDETCGNGVLDVVTGESCDCGGDADHMPASCTMPNSDDVRSECTTDCKLRRCGDGEVGGAEVCDGSDSVSDSVTCGNFGYYAGAVSCSALCQYDISGCSERCGDHIVQSQFETCDGDAPTDQTCLDFGYDVGWLGCTGLCSAGLSDCDRFGWSRAHPKIAFAADVAARDPRVLIRFADGSVSLLIDDALNDPSGSFEAIATTATASYAIAATHVAAYTNAGWADLPIAPPWSGQVYSAWASTTIGLLVSVRNDPNVYQWNGTAWITLPLPAVMANPRFGGSISKPYLFDFQGTAIAAWNGSGFSLQAFVIAGASALLDVAETESMPATLYIASNVGLHVRATNGTFSDTGLPGTRVEANTLGGVDVLAATKIVRLGAGSLAFDAPAGTTGIAEDVGRIYVVGPPGGVFALRKGAWQEIDPPSIAPAGYNYLHAAVMLKGNSDVVITGSDTEQYAQGRGWTQVQVPGGTLDELKSSAASLSITQTTLTVKPTTGSASSKDFATIKGKMLYFTRGDLYIAGDSGVAVYSSGSLNETQVDNVTFNAIDGIDAGAVGAEVIAVGIDNVGGSAAIYRFLGTWSPVDPGIPTKALRDVFVTDTKKVFAISIDKVFHGSTAGSDWKSFDVPGASLTAISGTSENDYFVAGTGTFGFPFTGLAHWDGTHFYPVRLPAAGTPKDIFVTQGAVYLLLTDPTGTDHVWVLVRSTNW